ncbi:class I SAM-dependent methyltransferase [Ferdinandcohnia quinoae]|uniref:Class I SAM-dependent methyltransferase n=1 Tax=Fredinandcohnia quinoae TaxID=2918902 RepID=A0AAW5E840_9BACI|nr:class I SAM-dependent methyltransferase [Fredinandcohnia sp. SECRCQ15]MCH1626092.1 class I SAM-dependent methyltransferase [Fredinandcohnia sp. SECRCQ15]
MGDHYYTSKPSAESNQKNWSFSLRGELFTFTSDNGVFSKKEVDFGSRLLIEDFVLPDIDGRLLDLGCGYGPIGLSMARSFNERLIEMVDVNERALELSKKNADINRIENISIYKSDVFSNISTNAFAAILTNPPIRAGKKVVHQILEESYGRLVVGGELWVVIQKKQGAPSAIEKLETVFEEVEVVARKKGYLIIKAKRLG